MWKIIVLVLFCAGCSGIYIEKHLKITGTNVRCPYGSGNMTIDRDVYFGRETKKLSL